MDIDSYTLSPRYKPRKVRNIVEHPRGVTPSVRVSRDVSPFRPPFFTSGTPSGWVFRCQTYSCWASFFHFEPISLGNICEIFIFSHSFWVIFVKIWFFGWGYNLPRGYSGWGENSPRGPVSGRSVPPGEHPNISTSKHPYNNTMASQCP